MNVELMDGKVINLADGSSALDVCKSINNSLYKKTLAAKINDKVSFLGCEVKEGDKLQFVSWEHGLTPASRALKIAHCLNMFR